MSNFSAFKAVIDGNSIIEELNNKKIPKPLLSDEQKLEINNFIFISYTNQINIKIKIYRQEYLQYINGYITKIIPSEQKIILNKKQSIYFHEIISIKELEF